MRLDILHTTLLVAKTATESDRLMASRAERAAQQPDWALLANREMVDGGPRYTETPTDPFSPFTPIPAEPWNAVTASLFIGLVAVWIWRLRGRYRDFPFLTCCLPILLICVT